MVAVRGKFENVVRVQEELPDLGSDSKSDMNVQYQLHCNRFRKKRVQI